MQKYSAHGYEVLDIAVTEDNARFASVGGDKQVFLWDVATARTLRRWSGHYGRVNCVGFGGEDDSVVISGSYILGGPLRLECCPSRVFFFGFSCPNHWFLTYDPFRELRCDGPALGLQEPIHEAHSGFRGQH